QKPAGSHAVPDEPAGTGSVDGRPVAGNARPVARTGAAGHPDGKEGLRFLCFEMHRPRHENAGACLSSAAQSCLLRLACPIRPAQTPDPVKTRVALLAADPPDNATPSSCSSACM